MNMKPHLNDTSYNEGRKPLEEVFIQIEDGNVKKKIPALSKYFSCSREIIKYEAPPKKKENGEFHLGAKEDWILRAESCLEDFLWLLNLPHYRFWSQLMYEKKSMDGLVSFLQEGFPFYCLDLLPDDSEVVRLYHRVSHMAYLLVRRIMTRVESQREWISEKTYAKLLYNNFVISIPMLIDICAIYGMSNRGDVRSILSFVFSIQPLYKEDLHKMVSNVKSVFRSIADRFSAGGNFEAGEIMKLSDRKKFREEVTLEFLEDMLLYLLDVSVSLSVFIDLCPIAGLIMHDHQIEVTIACFYSTVLPIIGSNIKRLCNDETLIVAYFNLVMKLNQIRYHLVKLLHLCLIVSLDTVISEGSSGDDDRLKDTIDNHLMVLNDCLSEKLLVKDYHTLYPIDVQLERLATLSPHIDSMKIKFLIDSLASSIGGGSAKAENNRQNKKEELYGSGGSMKDKKRREKSGQDESESKQRSERTSRQAEEPCAVPPEATNSSSMQFEESSTPVSGTCQIAELKEIFPDLGEGFLQRCLEYYNHSTSSVLNAILENSLADDLCNLDPELPLLPKECQFEERPFPERVNIFDNDEFDIMTRDTVDTSRIHKGKRKETYKDLAEMMNDKCHVQSLKESYSKYSTTWVETDHDYDDEYDDSYDSVPLPVEEVGDESRRPFETPRVLQTGRRTVAEEEEEDDEDGDEEKNAPGSSGFVPFVENPEVARARWEQKRNSQPRRQYSGRPKGQGQEEQVLFNRHKKNVNKSLVSNHNRRKMAQHKRGQGVIPS